MTGKELILERRSIREFSDEYISNDTLLDLLEAAQYAPSWANSQTPYFIVIRDKNIIKTLVETCYPNNRGAKASLSSNLVIVSSYEKGKAGYYKGSDFNVVGTWSMFDLGSACQNIALRAHELGLGSVLIGAYDYENAKNIIKLEEKYEIGPILAIGKRTELPQTPKRKHISEIYRSL